MRLVWIGKAVWQVLAIADRRRQSVKDEVEALAASEPTAERMLATLEIDVPLNGPPQHNKTKCNSLGDDIFELKENQLRVLWFYDAGEPKTRKRIICTHLFTKKTRKTPPEEKRRAVRFRTSFLNAKSTGMLVVPTYKGKGNE